MASGHRSQIKKERNEANQETRPHAIHKYARVSDMKARIVLDQIKGKDVGTAISILTYSPRYASELILKVLKSAIANAENNQGREAADLFIKEVFADQGPTMRRIRPRARGRADRISKRTSHIKIILDERVRAK
ncbi:MAG: 50S ribosomal protein L22 [Defluviitaleaceae bacterium]|nr:50S ribosomal protein L22 [Defluviitaleaceae bacterium]